MGIQKKQDEAQLPLFDINEPMPPPSMNKPTTVVDFVRARFEANPENMTQEEYKRWIKILIESSLRRME